MKSIILILVAFFVFNTTYSQDSFNGIDQFEALEVSNLSSSNKDAVNVYFRYGLNHNNVSNYVKELHNKVMNINIRDSKSFDGRKDLFKALFKSPKGIIIAYYNSNGEIVNAYEEYKNVSLPLSVSRQIFSVYNGWSLNSNKLVIRYSNTKGYNIKYNIQIKKGNLKKNVKVGASENLY